MKKGAVGFLTILVALFLGMLYGMVSIRRHWFPYPQLTRARDALQEQLGMVDDEWSIAIYEGPSPLELTNPPAVANPVLTAADVTDVAARFVADPFMVIEDNGYHLFFEVLNGANNQGDIAHAASPDGHVWTYTGIVLDEPIHLSYPCVFKAGTDYYMVPEGCRDYSVRLYRATSFPHKWRLVKRILTGYAFVDTSIFHYNGRWWLFHTRPANDNMNCYYADAVEGDWRAHPMNPLVRDNRQSASTSGRVVMADGRLYRFAQDCREDYGRQVYAFEITELTPTTYAETMIGDAPVLQPSGTGWNATGMHHVDAHQRKGGWIAVVDGKRR